jgi:hypothetical protein
MVEQAIGGRFHEIVSAVETSKDASFTIGWQPCAIKQGDVLRDVALMVGVDGGELSPQPLHRVEITTTGSIEVVPVAMTHVRLGDKEVAFGEFELMGRSSVAVATAVDAAPKITVRMQPAKPGDEIVEFHGPLTDPGVTCY